MVLVHSVSWTQGKQRAVADTFSLAGFMGEIPELLKIFTITIIIIILFSIPDYSRNTNLGHYLRIAHCPPPSLTF